MKKWLAGARMILVCTWIALYLVIVGIPVLLYCRIISDPRLALRLTKLLNRMVLFLAGVKVEAVSTNLLVGDRGYVFVGNHRSHVDPCAAWSVISNDVRFLVKKEVFRIPLVSFALRTMGLIEVDRSDPEAAARSIDRAVAEIQRGHSMILFPEGTRSRSPHMLPFKKGAFVLAIKAGAPIVPFTILGADEALKPDTIWLYGGKVKVIFHTPIETAGMDLEMRNELLERARHEVESTFLEWQRTRKD
jgi:1-acyl-sn-glycerol-3-phosphate acyltransferase